MEETPTNFKRGNPTRRGLRAWMFFICSVVLIQLFSGQTNAQRSRGPWQTLSGESLFLSPSLSMKLRED